MSEIKIVDISSNPYIPKWRLTVDGIIVAGHCNLEDLIPLYEELESDNNKAEALRDTMIKIVDKYGDREFDDIFYVD